MGLLLHERMRNGISEDKSEAHIRTAPPKIEGKIENYGPKMGGDVKNPPRSLMAVMLDRPKIPAPSISGRDDYNEVLYDVLQQAIQEKYNHELSFYFRKDRHRELVDVRHQVLYLYRFMSTESLIKMERRFGLHHATVLHSCECAENLRIFDSEFAKNYEELSSKINAKLEQL